MVENKIYMELAMENNNATRRFRKVMNTDYYDETNSGLISIARYRYAFGNMNLGDDISIVDPIDGESINTYIHSGQWRIDRMTRFYRKYDVKSGDIAIIDVDPENHLMTIMFEKKI